ncbi:MAG: YraN family protein [Spirochaetaceae bacterium]|nr:YraN family protein [Spirochaetaceae bacterium]
MTNKQKGNEGEEKVCNYLKSNGLKIIARNFKSRRGEVDIITREEDCLVFIEVKSWLTYSYEDMEYAINKRKMRNIMLTALEFVEQHPAYAKLALRFDVAFLSRKTGELHYIKNAFEGDGTPL